MCCLAHWDSSSQGVRSPMSDISQLPTDACVGCNGISPHWRVNSDKWLSVEDSLMMKLVGVRRHH